MRICTISGCDKPLRGHGLCNAHLLKLQRHGNPTASYKDDRSKPWAFVRRAIAYTGDDCLLWPYDRKPGRWGGYGRIRDGRRKAYVHILVCEAVHGSTPTLRHQVAHSCGQSACVNPRHLRWATPKENKADQYFHGTINQGQRNGAVKLTRTQVAFIRANPQFSGPELAELFDVTRATVNRIRRGERWAWL